MMMAKGAVTLAAAMTCATAWSETVLFDNLGDGETYDSSVGWGIGFGNDWQSGPGFVMNAGGDFYLTSISAAILWHGMGANEVTLSVYASEAGVPGTLLEATTLVDVLPDFTGWSEPPTSFEFSGTTVLTDGATYWVVASTPMGSELAWQWNVTDDVGLHTFSQGGGPWIPYDNEVRGAMRVSGVLVPAPSALTVLALAGVTVGRRRRRIESSRGSMYLRHN